MSNRSIKKLCKLADEMNALSVSAKQMSSSDQVESGLSDEGGRLYEEILKECAELARPEAMTTNQTIDGVSRKSLEQALKLAAVFDDGCDGADAESARGVVWILRALLDAPACSACNDTGRMHEPGCEPGACTACLEKPAAQPQPVARVEIGADRNAALTVTNDDWLRSLKDRGVHQIVSLYAEQPAPVAVDVLITGFHTTESGGGKYAINIGFRSMADMQAADAQLRELLKSR